MKRLIYLVLLAGILQACKTQGNSIGQNINLFSIDQDKQLGAQVAHEIDSNPKEYPVIDSAKNVALYAYMYKVRNLILNSGQVKLKDQFEWRVRVIQNDSVMNAFCTPGGYIYVYTGILKFLDSEDQLAGVLGHEIGHADMRHSTRQMTQMYGVQILLDVIAGKHEAIKQISGAIIGLKFSRNHETEADACSVRYLCPTPYKADGGAGFFEKIQNLGGAKQPEFLSTHPDPGNRIEHFHTAKEEQNCQGNNQFKTEYAQMLKLLPK